MALTAVWSHYIMLDTVSGQDETGWKSNSEKKDKVGHMQWAGRNHCFLSTEKLDQFIVGDFGDVMIVTHTLPCETFGWGASEMSLSPIGNSFFCEGK
ncbi:unnamed protein product [Haemonchus placei]|uniref:PHTB1_N domain-containing protein n=1 Tax=Haemonchus placei TaxID=6290 RepID=A0A0N4WSG2_HAEPC|nr:unnamed protein product [Haemonchus placei]